jgi:hypothetical protein
MIWWRISMTLKEIVIQWATHKLAEDIESLSAQSMLNEVASDTGQTLYQLVSDASPRIVIDVDHINSVLMITKTGSGPTDVDFRILPVSRPK